MKGAQCYELFRGIALRNHGFLSFFLKNVIRRLGQDECIESSNIYNNLQRLDYL